jgi:hypothetical protein
MPSSPRAKSGRDDWDARSCYSVTSEYPEEDDEKSVTTAHSRKEDQMSNVSNLDTLSFYSDPILTPYELTVMGDRDLPKRQ